MITAIALELDKETKAEAPNEQIIQQLKQLLEHHTNYTIYINDNSADSIFYSFSPKKKASLLKIRTTYNFLLFDHSRTRQKNGGKSRV